MKPKTQLVFIVLVIILILLGESIAYLPLHSTAGVVVIKTYPSANSLIQALQNGEVDIAPIPSLTPQALQELKDNPNLNITALRNFGFTYIGMNLRRSPLSNSDFRKAMLYGFDRESVVRVALDGYGETLTPSLFSTAYDLLGWRNDSVGSYPYDPGKAAQILDSLGYTQSSSGVRTDPSTGELLHTMFIYSKLSDPASVSAANMFAEDMQAIGLPVISFPESDFDFYSIRVNYYFDLFVDSQPAGAAPTWLFTLFAAGNDLYPAPYSTNVVGYDNATFQTYAGLMMASSNDDSAKAAALRCQEQLGVDLPALPIYSQDLLIAERNDAPTISAITGSIPDTLAATLSNITRGITVGVVGELSDLNPAVGLGADSRLALRMITDPLFTRAADGSIEPGLVDRWGLTDNATSLTLRLQPGAQFNDGSPTTADNLAATINWMVENVVPSSPMYPTLTAVKNVVELDGQTIHISLSKSNYFATYDFADLFALPTGLLPSRNSPLALLLNGAFQQSGLFSLTRFVQGAEVDMQNARSGGVQALNGVLGQNVLGSIVSGSQVQVASLPLTYAGQTIDNATFTAQIGGASSTVIQGRYLGFGVYGASVNLNNQSLSVGNHRVTTELYAQLPTGVIVQFGQQNITIGSPLFSFQILLALLTAMLVAIVVYNAKRAKARRVKRTRGRRPRPRLKRSPRESRVKHDIMGRDKTRVYL